MGENRKIRDPVLEKFANVRFLPFCQQLRQHGNTLMHVHVHTCKYTCAHGKAEDRHMHQRQLKQAFGPSGLGFLTDFITTSLLIQITPLSFSSQEWMRPPHAPGTSGQGWKDGKEGGGKRFALRPLALKYCNSKYGLDQQHLQAWKKCTFSGPTHTPWIRISAWETQEALLEQSLQMILKPAEAVKYWDYSTNILITLADPFWLTEIQGFITTLSACVDSKGLATAVWELSCS